MSQTIKTSVEIKVYKVMYWKDWLHCEEIPLAKNVCGETLLCIVLHQTLHWLLLNSVNVVSVKTCMVQETDYLVWVELIALQCIECC